MTVQRSPRGPYKKGIERRQEVVAVAVEVFGRKGFKGGTLQQVGDKVGLTPAAIIKLFGSKEKLLIAVLEHWGVVTAGIVGPEAKGYGSWKASNVLWPTTPSTVGSLSYTAPWRRRRPPRNIPHMAS
jgi:hypothetical protein